MDRVVFSSWGGNIVDNRRKTAGYTPVENLEFPLEHNGHRVRAFMSWRGLVVADEKINVADMAHTYLKEVQKLSCGECSVGYLGIRVMLDTLTRILGGEGTEEDIALLRWLGNGIKENTKCDFCALALTPVLDSLKYYEGEYTRLSAAKGRGAKPAYLTRITAPCMEACPAHQDAPGYIELISNRRYEEALALIRQTNCLPGTMGRACFAFCEENCTRGDIDKPVSIRALKRVPADYEVTADLEPEAKVKKAGGDKVAVIGAGPAGLAASYNLALKGYRVTIYDEQPSVGGMAWVGIPAFRLPRNVLGREVDIIKKLGIDVKLNTRVGKDISLEQLLKQGFKAVFIATGAHAGRELGIEVEGGGVVDGVEFLRDVNMGQKVAVKKRVIIVGGGNVAIDCARTCLRLGFKEVTILYRRSRAEMPARGEEIEAAEAEGAKIHYLAAPVKALTEGGQVTGVECIRMKLGEPDDSGRRRPIPIEGSEFTIGTDMIIPAIGEKPDLSLIEGKSINITKWGTIVVDAPTGQTSLPGVFAGGDCVSGPATLVEAIAAGNKAARSIDRYLKSGRVTPPEEQVVEDWLHDVALSHQRDGNVVAKKERQSPEQLPVAKRKRGFDEVEQCLTLEMAAKEAERCLRCYRVMLLAVDGKK
ncbi:MAG TPA: FAD-dependent oxidoreductase [Dehalococcoidales bacterium]|nr:FAD-dependent oxidoreductase [Dehalococcoidales bacterium]